MEQKWVDWKTSYLLCETIKYVAFTFLPSILQLLKWSVLFYCFLRRKHEDEWSMRKVKQASHNERAIKSKNYREFLYLRKWKRNCITLRAQEGDGAEWRHFSHIGALHNEAKSIPSCRSLEIWDSLPLHYLLTTWPWTNHLSNLNVPNLKY